MNDCTFPKSLLEKIGDDRLRGHILRFLLIAFKIRKVENYLLECTKLFNAVFESEKGSLAVQDAERTFCHLGSFISNADKFPLERTKNYVKCLQKLRPEIVSELRSHMRGTFTGKKVICNFLDKATAGGKIELAHNLLRDGHEIDRFMVVDGYDETSSAVAEYLVRNNYKLLGDESLESEDGRIVKYNVMSEEGEYYLIQFDMDGETTWVTVSRA